MHWKVLLSISFAFLGLTAATAPAPAQKAAAQKAAGLFNVDAVHSSVVFRVKHMGISWFYGRFTDINGSFAFDPADDNKCSVDVEVKAASVDTHDGKRDDHLKGPDFFNVKQFPTIAFKSTDVEKKDATHYKVTGDFTLHGVTKSVTAELEKSGEGKDQTGGARMGFETTFTIKRGDFGMKYGAPDMLGDEVRITVSVEGGSK